MRASLSNHKADILQGVRSISFSSYSRTDFTFAIYVVNVYVFFFLFFGHCVYAQFLLFYFMPSFTVVIFSRSGEKHEPK